MINYKNVLSDLYVTDNLLRVFKLGHYTLPKALEEKQKIETLIKKDDRNLLLRIFDNDLYQDRKINLNDRLDRINSVVKALEENPNKEQGEFSLFALINKSIDIVKTHLTEKEIEEVKASSYDNYGYGRNIDGMSIRINTNNIYFKDEPVEEVQQERTEQNTNINTNINTHNIDREM